ncbi:hypothetical protein FSOLCH5_015369 [Fusarium solani]
MHAIKTIALAFAAFAASAAAAPTETTGSKSPNVQQAVAQCSGNNNGRNQISCCNSASKQAQKGAGLVGNVVGNVDILGGNCSPLSIPVAVLGGAASVPITEFCNQNQQAACCSGDQNGLINVDVSCIPIIV